MDVDADADADDSSLTGDAVQLDPREESSCEKS